MFNVYNCVKLRRIVFKLYENLSRAFLTQAEPNLTSRSRLQAS